MCVQIFTLLAAINRFGSAAADEFSVSRLLIRACSDTVTPTGRRKAAGNRRLQVPQSARAGRFEQRAFGVGVRADGAHRALPFLRRDATRPARRRKPSFQRRARLPNALVFRSVAAADEDHPAAIRFL
jgi:hypothetical protein